MHGLRPRASSIAHVQTKVFKVRCKLGLREGQVRRTLEALRREPGAELLTAEGLPMAIGAAPSSRACRSSTSAAHATSACRAPGL
jgi:hypothetical protein